MASEYEKVMSVMIGIYILGPLNATVELRGGSGRREGRVEVTIGNWTGAICDDSFGVNDAKVVCKMLGFRSEHLPFIKTVGTCA